MVIEEKISLLKQVKILLLESNSWLENTKKPIRESFDTAIKSLEAWEKVKEEVLKTQTYKMFEGDTDLYVERKDVLKIIDKHLKEVEK